MSAKPINALNHIQKPLKLTTPYWFTDHRLRTPDRESEHLFYRPDDILRNFTLQRASSTTCHLCSLASHYFFSLRHLAFASTRNWWSRCWISMKRCFCLIMLRWDARELELLYGANPTDAREAGLRSRR